MRRYLEGLGLENVKHGFGWDDEDQWGFTHKDLPGFGLYWLPECVILDLKNGKKEDLPRIVVSSESLVEIKLLARLMLERG